MKEVLIKFEEQGLEGIVAVDTYLMDAAKRLGAAVDDRCRLGEEVHHCSMTVGEGSGLLSDPTKAETDLFSSADLKKGKRLACQAKFVKPGEVKIMSVEKNEDTKKQEEEAKPEEEFKKEFEAMPLDQKFASLVELEAMALGETFAYVINSPYDAFGKVMDVLADFGWKKDRADQEAKKPEEHSEKKESKDATGENGTSKEPMGKKKTEKKKDVDKAGSDD